MYDSEVKFINFTGLAKKYDIKNKEGKYTMKWRPSCEGILD